MEKLFSLDNRLMLCAEMVRKDSTVADIGTDHAYLPVWLCKKGVCKKGLACDIKSEPLKNGIKTIEKYEAQKLVEPRISDGLLSVGENEADDIVIAGMGGELIVRIMSEWKYSKNSDKRFILQPMTKCEEVIRFLCENGFEILAQKSCVADKKVYTVLNASYVDKTFTPENVFWYLGKLDPKANETDMLYAQNVVKHLEKKQRGDSMYKQAFDEICEYLGEKP